MGPWGKRTIALVEGELLRVLRGRGINVTRISSGQLQILDRYAHEIDLLAKNGEVGVVVEVKTTLVKKDVDYFLNTLQIFTKSFPEFKDCKIYGVVGFTWSTTENTRYAYRKGLFYLRAVAENARILNDTGFKPHNFIPGHQAS
ncbi:MAG: hypothetical protein N2050_08610 [Flavobacteriales bacterium]|nr:hypothetical protein [Flavobacteriales bacterium]